MKFFLRLDDACFLATTVIGCLFKLTEAFSREVDFLGILGVAF